MMLSATVLFLGCVAQGTESDASATFAERLKHATGPAQLRQLELWCGRNRMADERKRIQELLQKAGAKPDAREAARVVGDQARQVVTEFREGRAKAAAEEVRKVLGWMTAEKYAPPEAKDRLKMLVGALLADEAQVRESLLSDLKSVEHADRMPDDQKKASANFDTQVKAVLKKFSNPLFSAIEKCLAASEAGYAFDLYRFLLQVDPDNERAHRSLGEQKVEGRWLRPYELEQWKAGFLWDEKAGWVPIKSRERAEQGEIYDQAAKQWGKAADLDRQHAEVSRAWRMESEHFELVSTADHAVNVRLLARMEAFFLQAFRQYDLFFTGKGGGKAASMIFGVVPAKKKLLVNYYRDEAQFKNSASPPTSWAAGFYSGGKHASYFYHIPQETHFYVMQHELTHQILGEYSEGGGGGGPWLAEGAAVYLEAASFRNGTLCLGGIHDNYELEEYRTQLKAGGKEHSLKYMLDTFGPGQSWNRGDISMNYRSAGAIVYFLMTMDGGRYRADTIQLLRDSYFGKPKGMEDYFGISVAGLDFLMDRFYRECDAP